MTYAEKQGLSKQQSQEEILSSEHFVRHQKD